MEFLLLRAVKWDAAGTSVSFLNLEIASQPAWGKPGGFPYTAGLSPGVLGAGWSLAAPLQREEQDSAQELGRGCVAVRGAAWAAGRAFPLAALADGAPGIEGRGLTLGPLITGDRRGIRRLAVEVPDGRGVLLLALLDWGLLMGLPHPGTMGRGR
ncbi:hypothetical protein NDU88_004376 [Pleurodeles waltl]|uniref:Uncharacterized protein n=1 Tax=Pleurodeles waltl TaxID=8319 RepID=A0AAV7NJD8_PLEWA|nr:hypothetical protein NDU88_004376 [Pleurodeles waltl]